MKEFDDFYNELCSYREIKRNHLLQFFQTNDEAIKLSLEGITITFHQRVKEFLENSYFESFGKPDLEDDSIFYFFDSISYIINFQELDPAIIQKKDWNQKQN